MTTMGHVGRASSGSSVVRSSPPFVDRADCVARMMGELRATVRGNPRMVMVEAHAGTGKTRLVREFLARIEDLNLRVIYGRGIEHRSGSFQAFDTLLGELALQAPSGEAASAPATLPLFARDDDEGVRARRFMQLGRAALALCRSQPTILVVDDLHFCDAASLELLQHLVFAASDAALNAPVPLMVIATLRPPAAGSPLATVAARLRREEFVSTIELAGLDEDHVGELLRGLGLRRAANQLVRTISRATAGNPLFVQEALRHLERRGALLAVGEELTTTASAPELSLPQELSEALAARIEALCAETRDVLSAAALLGEHFTLDLLVETSARDEDRVVAAIDEGLAHDLLYEQHEALHFTHSLIHRAFYARLGKLSRRRLHARAAATLAARRRGPETTLEVSQHLIAAGNAADDDLVIAVCPQAGHFALSSFAPADAAAAYELALRAAERLGRAPSERAELHALASVAYYRNSDRGPALSHCENALALVRELRDAAGEVAALTQRLQIVHVLGRSEYGETFDTSELESALLALGEREPGLRSRVLSTLASTMWVRRDAARAEGLAQQALEIACGNGDAATAAHALTLLALSRFQRIALQQSVDEFREAIRRARDAGDLWAQGRSEQRLPLPLFMLGEVRQAEAIADNAVHLGRSTNDWAGVSHAAALQTVCAAARGRLDWAERTAHVSMVMVRRSRYHWSASLALPALACALALTGRSAQARQILAELDPEDKTPSETASGSAFLMYLYGRLIDAWSGGGGDPTELLSIMERRTRRWRQDAYALAMLCALAELAALGGVTTAGRWLEEPLAHALKQGAHLTTGWVFSVARCLGVLRHTAGAHDEARELFELAIEVTEEQAPVEQARSRLALAELLLEIGETERGGQELSLAVASCDELDLRPFSLRARQLGQQYAIRMPSMAPQETALRPTPHAARPADFKAPSDSGELRVVFFSDMEGFTALIDRLGDRRARQVVRIHDRILRAAVAQHGGSEIQHTGDGLMVAFDSADAALRCARQIHSDCDRHSLTQPSAPIRVRIGIHAGMTLAQEDRLFGATINAAARLCDRARAGTTLVSEAVRELLPDELVTLSDAGSQELKGFSTPFRVYEVS